MANFIQFTKMHALGNDFVLIDRVTQNFMPTARFISLVADRRFGIGCDQILIAEPPIQPDSDFFLRIYNQDGSEARQCGNGARCFARFVYERGLTPKNRLQVDTLSGLLYLSLREDNLVSVKIPPPQFDPKSVPTLLKPKHNFEYELPMMMGLGLNFPKRCHILSMGNPHCIITVPNILEVDLAFIGRQLQNPALFPNGVNVSLVQQMAKNHILLRTFERGVGETLSCGSAASAAIVTGICTQDLSKEVKVSLTHGSLTLKWPNPDAPVELIGPTQSVFQGYLMHHRSEDEPYYYDY